MKRQGTVAAQYEEHGHRLDDERVGHKRACWAGRHLEVDEIGTHRLRVLEIAFGVCHNLGPSSEVDRLLESARNSYAVGEWDDSAAL